MTTNFPGDLRDYFAGKAMAGLLADSFCTSSPDVVAQHSYLVADAMMAARATDDKLPPIDTSTGGIEPELIDFTKPIELIADGTPLVVASGPDEDGNYRVRHEYGQRWSPLEDYTPFSSWYFNRCGELGGYKHLGPLIRNRREA